MWKPPFQPLRASEAMAAEEAVLATRASRDGRRDAWWHARAERRPYGRCLSRQGEGGGLDGNIEGRVTAGARGGAEGAAAPASIHQR